MTACGSDNIFFDLEQRDVATEATIAIERVSLTKQLNFV